MKGYGVAALAASAVGGYVLGRRHDELRARVECLLRSRDEVEQGLAEKRRLASYDTEFDHLADSEAAERHRIAAELRRRPLHERGRRDRFEEDETLFDGIASRGITRDRDAAQPRVGPRSL
jgi:hypothetical protein